MQTMKRLLAFALALTMVFALAACGGKSGTTDSTAAAPTAAAVTENAVYRTLYASEVTTLNYLITGQTNELTIAANVVDCLVYGLHQSAGAEGQHLGTDPAKRFQRMEYVPAADLFLRHFPLSV